MTITNTTSKVAKFALLNNDVEGTLEAAKSYYSMWAGHSVSVVLLSVQGTFITIRVINDGRIAAVPDVKVGE